jgi:hypothetical protein
MTVEAVAAEFADAPALVAAARVLRGAGIGGIEGFGPNPIDGLDEVLAKRRSPIPAIILAAGLAGALGGFLLQYIPMAWAYPLNIGGRPLDSWPAYLPSTYELAVLVALVVGFAAFATVTGMIRLYDPVQRFPGFERASQDRYLLWVDARDPAFDAELVERLLIHSAASRIVEVQA